MSTSTYYPGAAPPSVAPPTYEQASSGMPSSQQGQAGYAPVQYGFQPATLPNYAGPASATAYPGPAYPTPYGGAAGSVYQPAGTGYGAPMHSYPPTAPKDLGYDGSGQQPYGGGYRNEDVALINDVPVVIIASDTDSTAPTSGNDESWVGSSFSNKKIRQAFIRKVFLILMAQLSVTVGFICLFIFCEPLKLWVHSTGFWFYIAAYMTFLITYIVLVCCPSLRRASPGNFICLAIFTLALSWMAGTISSFHETEIVLIAIAITTAVCLSLAIFAIQSKIDFTMCSGLLFALTMVLFFFGLTVIIGGAFVSYESYFIMHCVYGGLAALLFSLFLVYDIQVVMGGGKYELSPEEYIFGALQIYLDIVYLFLIILSLMGGKK